MKSKYFSGGYSTNFKIINLILVAFFFIQVACKDNPAAEEITVVLKNSETFKYPVVSSDEEGILIKNQARNFEISEVVRNLETNYVPVYTYKPKANYIGNDFVELEIRKGSDGASQPTQTIIIFFTFIIKNFQDTTKLHKKLSTER